MKCLDCGAEMEQGTAECVGAGFESWYEFTSETEKRKKELRDRSPSRPLPFLLPWRSTPHGIVPGAEKF